MSAKRNPPILERVDDEFAADNNCRERRSANASRRGAGSDRGSGLEKRILKDLVRFVPELEPLFVVAHVVGLAAIFALMGYVIYSLWW